MSIQSNFDNGTILEIYITDAYTGDVTTTEWNLLDLTVPTVREVVLDLLNQLVRSIFLVRETSSE